MAIFSLFLQISSKTLPAFIVFVLLFYAFLGAYMLLKYSNIYTLDRNGIEMRAFLRAARNVNYSEIESLSVSQGFLAKRFGCGTVYLNLRHKGGRIRILGGGSAEAMRDVKSPKSCEQLIESKLSNDSEKI